MIKAIILRNKDELAKVPGNKPGYYKWWAEKTEFDALCKGLGVEPASIINEVETKDGLYCIYVGVAVGNSIRTRLDWHINDSNDEERVSSGFLSTFRESIGAVIAHDQRNKDAINDFIDKLYVEYYVLDCKIKSDEAKTELERKEDDEIASHLRLLNIQKNHYEGMEPILKTLRDLRAASK